MNYKTIHERVKPAAPLLKGSFGRELRCSITVIVLSLVLVSTNAWAATVQTFVAASAPQDALTGSWARYLDKVGKEPVLNDRPQKKVFYGLSAGCFLPLLLVSGDAGGDALSNLFEQYCNWANNLHPYVFQFLVRATLVLGLSSLFCWLAFRRGNRSALLQAFILLNSVFLALAIPVEHWHLSHRVIKAWVVAICVFLTATLPAVLPMFVAPELGNQQRIRRVTFGVLLVLFIGTLIRALSSWKS
jgi:hypothetical protein